MSKIVVTSRRVKTQLSAGSALVAARPYSGRLVAVYNPVANPLGLSTGANRGGLYGIPTSTAINVVPLQSVAAASTMTLVALMRGTGGSGNFGVGLCDSIRFRKNSATVGQLFVSTATGGDAYSGTFAIPDRPFVLIIQVNFGGFGYRVWVDGVLVLSSAFGGVPRLTKATLQLGGSEFGNGGGTQINFAALINSAVGLPEIRSISDNPLSILRGRRRRTFNSRISGNSLSAGSAGFGATSGSASPSVQVGLSAIGVSTGSGGGGAVANVPLSATAISISSGAGAPSATVTISAAGLAQAGGASGLSAGVLLAAAGAALSAGNGQLAILLTGLGQAAAVSSGAALISTQEIGNAAAAGLASQAASAGISASVILAGLAAAQSAGIAGLTASLSAMAAGYDQVGGSAALAGGAPGVLSAGGQSMAQGAGQLKVDIALAASGSAFGSDSALGKTLVNVSAAGFVQAMADGYWRTSVPLSAFGNVSSWGSANGIISEIGDLPPRPAGIFISISPLTNLVMGIEPNGRLSMGVIRAS